MNEMMIFWLVVVILTIIIEAISLGLTSIWFAGGALIALIVAACGGPLALQIILFFIVSLLLLFFTRPIAVKYFNKDRVRTNAEGLIGRQAIVISEVDNLQGIGQATVSGREWSARSVDADVKIPVGAVVEIVAIDGVKLIVKEDMQAKQVPPVVAPGQEVK